MSGSTIPGDSEMMPYIVSPSVTECVGEPWPDFRECSCEERRVSLKVEQGTVPPRRTKSSTT